MSLRFLCDQIAATWQNGSTEVLKSSSKVYRTLKSATQQMLNSSRKASYIIVPTFLRTLHLNRGSDYFLFFTTALLEEEEEYFLRGLLLATDLL